MPPRGLPGNANLEHLREGAESFQRAVRAGDPGAAAVVREFHPRLAGAQPGSPELAQFRPADARAIADEFLRLACLNHGADDLPRRERAAELLAAHPWLPGAGIHTAAAVGDPAAAQRLLAEEPELAGREGGPYAREPLLYLTYSRVSHAGGSAVAVARLLLDHGADPNAGYLWEGLVPPFTALVRAAERNSREAVALLIDLGFDVNAMIRTAPLHEAAMRGNLEVIRLLLEHAGLVEHYKLGRERRCRLVPGPLEQADAWLARYREFWAGRFAGLSEHLARRDG